MNTKQYSFEKTKNSVKVFRNKKLIADIKTTDPDALLDALRTNAGAAIIIDVFLENRNN